MKEGKQARKNEGKKKLSEKEIKKSENDGWVRSGGALRHFI
jgi:hypothetical protein